jgi:spermidine synthase
VSKRFWRDYPEIQVDTVEIDPVVIEVAGKYFGLPDDPRLRVINEDARRYVQRTDERYDIVIIDAYNADSMPFHLTTEEFFREVDALLEPGGVVAYNIISAVEGRRSRLFRSLYRTAEGVWRDIEAFPIELSLDKQVASNRNIIMLATNRGLPAEELQRRIRERVDGRVSIKRFPAFADDLYTGEVTFEDAPILTDAHAPVDSLIAID